MDPEKRKGSAPPNLTNNSQFHQNGSSGHPGHYSNSRQARNTSINQESPMTTPSVSSGASLASRSNASNFLKGYIKDAQRPDFNNRINDSMARAENLIKAHNAAKAGRSLSTGNPPTTQLKVSNGFKKEGSPTIVEIPPTPIKKNFDFTENFGIVTNESGK